LFFHRGSIDSYRSGAPFVVKTGPKCQDIFLNIFLTADDTDKQTDSRSTCYGTATKLSSFLRPRPRKREHRGGEREARQARRRPRIMLMNANGQCRVVVRLRRVTKARNSRVATPATLRIAMRAGPREFLITSFNLLAHSLTASAEDTAWAGVLVSAEAGSPRASASRSAKPKL
jgi:hypothetical protein